MAHMNFKEVNWYRKIIQLIIVALLGYMVVRLFVDEGYIADFEAYCPFGGMQALGSFLVSNSLACSMNETQIFMGIILVVGVVLVSKLFCSYICPVGTFTEWLGKLGQKINMHYTIRGIADRVLRGGKYGLLFASFYFSVKSSELFCKEFDPYYAIFSGFDSDVFLWYAIPAIIITVLGAVFIRQFWCKYLCPLGAATNLFTYGIIAGGVIVIYLLLVTFGVDISWVWLLAVLAISGFILEMITMRGWVFPPFKITRDEKGCTACNYCDKACPMGIKISEQSPVRHIDCHLCGDCINACPEGGVLKINRRRMRWLPPAATVLLIAVGLLLATTIELPTINLRWGNEGQFETAAIFNKSDLKNIKCYGSSMSFASKMKQVQGVLGVETYVKSNTVKLFYNPDRLSEEDLNQALFTPSKTLLQLPAAGTENLAVVEMAIDKLFDSYDSFYLRQLLAQTGGIYGFTTEYGEPVKAMLYFNPDKISADEIKQVIEKDEVTYESRGKSYTVPLSFKVSSVADSTAALSKSDFMKRIFKPYNLTFNNYKDYDPEKIAVYELPMPQAINASLQRQMNLLVSHISGDTAIVRFETVYDEQPMARVYYLEGQISPDSIFESLNAESLTVHYRDGKTGQVVNPFRFKEKGETFSLKDD